MVRSGIAIAAILVLGAPALAEEAPRPAVDEAVQTARFSALVAKADRDRAAGKLPEAAMAYAEAFKIKEDPIVGGRLGALLVELRNPVQAADLLLDAIERGQDVASEERHVWLSAYDTARSQVCRVEVTVSEPHSHVTLDGLPKNRDGHTGFILFVPAGEHELRATLKGFEDAVIDFKAIKGGTLRYTLALRPLPSFAPIDPPERLLRRRQLDPATSVEEPPDDEPPKREPIRGGVVGDEKKGGIHGSINAGPVVVFGVASWQPAIGAVLGGSWRANEYVSVGLEGRAAWLTSGVADRPLNAMTVGGVLSVCGHHRFLFGCALGHVGAINVAADPASYVEKSVSFFMPGLGGRLGAKLSFGRSFTAQAGVDILGLVRGMKIVVGQTVLVDQPPLMVSAQVTGGWEF